MISSQPLSARQSGELTFRRQPRGEAEDLFGRLPGIGHDDERR